MKKNRLNHATSTAGSSLLRKPTQGGGKRATRGFLVALCSQNENENQPSWFSVATEMPKLQSIDELMKPKRQHSAPTIAHRLKKTYSGMGDTKATECSSLQSKLKANSAKKKS